jgi:hypothetical protein
MRAEIARALEVRRKRRRKRRRKKEKEARREGLIG